MLLWFQHAALNTGVGSHTENKMKNNLTVEKYKVVVKLVVTLLKFGNSWVELSILIDLVPC